VRDRGVGWVLAQFVLMGVVVVSWLAARDLPSSALVVVGAALGVAGVVLGGWAAATLGSSLTPFPRPKPDGELVTSGPFAFVRHPIYTALLLFFAGGSLLFERWALLGVAALAVLWTLKARVEERHLARAFPAYADYRRRVRARFVPLVY